MKKATIENSILAATSLLQKSVSESIILACLIRDGFTELRARTILLWAKRKAK